MIMKLSITVNNHNLKVGIKLNREERVLLEERVGDGGMGWGGEDACN